MEDNPLLMADLWKAYYDARRHKRRTVSHLAFQMELERNMQQLYRELLEGVYTPGAMICFVVHRPVKREIFASERRCPPLFCVHNTITLNPNYFTINNTMQ